jgi:ribosomal protein S27E
MSLLQILVETILPGQWADEIRAESRSWRIRCLGCGASRSVWDAGGVRWKATSIRKRTLVHCSHCGRLRVAAIERT